MRRIDNEDTAREIGSAGSHETAPGREGVFTERFVRFGTAPSFLATKGARARTEHAQRDHEGLCVFALYAPCFLIFSRYFLNPSFTVDGHRGG